MMLLRACSLSSGATASSQSRKMMSALDCAAFLNNAGLVPGTASSERCNLGVACWMVVKLMAELLDQGMRGVRVFGAVPRPPWIPARRRWARP